MKYAEFRDYLAVLKVQTGPFAVEINWDVIKSDQITAYADKRMGLQIADAVASSFFFGIQVNQYGFAEDRYARMLKSVVYNHRGRYNGYGLKVWPRECEPMIKTESHMVWLVESYSFD